MWRFSTFFLDSITVMCGGQCASSRECEVTQLVAQASTGYGNLKGCLSRSDTRGTCAAKATHGCSDAGNRKERLH
jgi:hypothetical protein